MDWQAIIIPIISALATGGTLAAIINARVSKQLGQEANEIEATKAENSIWEGYSKEIREMFILERDRFHSERQDLQRQLDDINETLDSTRSRVTQLEQREVRATRYIEKLKDHIWHRREPPPPAPDHGLDL